MRFTPGPGVGGHCLPIDPSYLAWRVKQHLGRTFRFVELANDVNEHMPDYVHARITSLLNEQRKSLNGSKVLLLGLAYKRGTSDWRESPSVVVAERLAASGADVEFCDPHIPEVNARNARFPLVDFDPTVARRRRRRRSCSSTIPSSLPSDDRRTRSAGVRRQEHHARHRLHRRDPLTRGHRQGGQRNFSRQSSSSAAPRDDNAGRDDPSQCLQCLQVAAGRL